MTTELRTTFGVSQEGAAATIRGWEGILAPLESTISGYDQAREKATQLEAQISAAEQAQRSGDFSVLQQARRRLDLEPRELQPELRALVDGHEEQLVAVRELVRRLLEGEQLVRPQVALVVACARPGKTRRKLVARIV